MVVDKSNGPFTHAIFDAILAAIYRASVNYRRFVWRFVGDVSLFGHKIASKFEQVRNSGDKSQLVYTGDLESPR